MVYGITHRAYNNVGICEYQILFIEYLISSIKRNCLQNTKKKKQHFNNMRDIKKRERARTSSYHRLKWETRHVT